MEYHERYNLAYRFAQAAPYTKGQHVGYNRWGEPNRECTLGIFKSFIAKTTLQLCKRKTWVQS